jgi:hypothetical protein
VDFSFAPLRMHREMKREAGCLTPRAVLDVGYVLRAFRVGLAEGLMGRYLFSGKLWSERQDLLLPLWTIEIPTFYSVTCQSCVPILCTRGEKTASHSSPCLAFRSVFNCPERAHVV